jgi:hypothetical protein
MSELLAPGGAGLVQRPQSYEEIEQRPDFSAPLDHKVHALRQVLSDYHFAKEIPCGLKSCRHSSVASSKDSLVFQGARRWINSAL